MKVLALLVFVASLCTASRLVDVLENLIETEIAKKLDMNGARKSCDCVERVAGAGYGAFCTPYCASEMGCTTAPADSYCDWKGDSSGPAPSSPTPKPTSPLNGCDCAVNSGQEDFVAYCNAYCDSEAMCNSVDAYCHWVGTHTDEPNNSGNDNGAGSVHVHKRPGSNHKCENTGNGDHVSRTIDDCRDEAVSNGARFFSYIAGTYYNTHCFYSTRCSNPITTTGWAWEIYEIIHTPVTSAPVTLAPVTSGDIDECSENLANLLASNRYCAGARHDLGFLGSGSVDKCAQKVRDSTACDGSGLFDYNSGYDGQCKCASDNSCTIYKGGAGYNVYQLNPDCQSSYTRLGTGICTGPTEGGLNCIYAQWISDSACKAMCSSLPSCHGYSFGDFCLNFGSMTSAPSGWAYNHYSATTITKTNNDSRFSCYVKEGSSRSAHRSRSAPKDKIPLFLKLLKAIDNEGEKFQDLLYGTDMDELKDRLFN